MLQYAYKDKIYIMGNISQVSIYLKELSSKYKTVKEYLEYQTKEL